ncbi:MAG: hypothetical protein KF729_19625 [Sandaracinaceae bacterium]|nr:hypothetical protein [Sandaracinaceae bacterium]
MRDLAGWCLSVASWAYPAAVLVAFAAWAGGPLTSFGFLVVLLAGLAWPSVYLLSRRLREASDLDRAEADGRPPVLVVHAFERTRTPWWARALPTPAFFRDLDDELLVRALRRGLEPAGPVVFVERPAPPPASGPMALATGRDEAHLEALAARAPSAALVVVVLDGTDTTRREIERLGEGVDVRRVALVVPPRAGAAFYAAYERIREALPGLPALSRAVAAVRFGEGTTPHLVEAGGANASARRAALGAPDRMLSPHERGAPAPAPPSWSWALSAIPVLAAFASMLLTPRFAQAYGLRMSSDDQVVSALLALALGVWLAVLSRRVMRLVPGSELPLILVAAGPWLLGELARLGAPAWGLSDALRAAGTFAAASAPLLLAVAFVLAGASWMRVSPGRRVAFAWFGLAATVPILTLALSLAPLGIEPGALVVPTLLCGLGLGAATVAASGDAGRRHAPLSVGSAVAATLALAGWLTAATHGEWHAALRASEYTAAAHFGEALAPLATYDQLAPWFLLPLPLVTLVGLLFAGRATRAAAASAASLLVLALALVLVGRAHRRAELALTERGLLGEDRFLAAAGAALLPGFELAPLADGETPRGPVDVVLDRGGAVAGGVRVSSEVELSSFGAMGTSALARALGDRLRERPDAPDARVAVAPDADGRALVAACRAAWAQGAPRAELIGRGPEGTPRAVFVGPRLFYGAGAQDRILLFIVLRADRVEVADTAGSLIQVPRLPNGALDAARLEAVLRERRQYEPNRRDVTLSVQSGASAGDVLAAAAAAWSTGLADVGLDDARL